MNVVTDQPDIELSDFVFDSSSGTQPKETDLQSATGTNSMMRLDITGSTISYAGQHETEEITEAGTTEKYELHPNQRSETSTDQVYTEQDIVTTEVFTGSYSTEKATDKSILSTSQTQTVSVSRTFPIDFSKVRKSKYLEVNEKIESQVDVVYAASEEVPLTTSEKRTRNTEEIKANIKESNVPQEKNFTTKFSNSESGKKRAVTENNRHHIQHIPSAKRIRVFKKINRSEENAIKELIYDSFQNKSPFYSNDTDEILSNLTRNQNSDRNLSERNATDEDLNSKKDINENLEESQSSRVQIYIRQPSSPESTDNFTGVSHKSSDTEKSNSGFSEALKIQNLRSSPTSKDTEVTQTRRIPISNERSNNRQINRGRIKFKESIMKENMEEHHASVLRPSGITIPLTARKHVTSTNEATLSTVSGVNPMRNHFSRPNFQVTLPDVNLERQVEFNERPQSASENKRVFTEEREDATTIYYKQGALKPETSTQALITTNGEANAKAEPSSHAAIERNDAMKHEQKGPIHEIATHVQSGMKENEAVVPTSVVIEPTIQDKSEQKKLKHESSTQDQSDSRRIEGAELQSDVKVKQQYQVKNGQTELKHELSTQLGGDTRLHGAKLPIYVRTKQNKRIENELAGLQDEFASDSQGDVVGHRAAIPAYVGHYSKVKHDQETLGHDILTYTKSSKDRRKPRLPIRAEAERNDQVKREYGELEHELPSKIQSDPSKSLGQVQMDHDNDDNIEQRGQNHEFSNHSENGKKGKKTESSIQAETEQMDQLISATTQRLEQGELATAHDREKNRKYSTNPKFDNEQEISFAETNSLGVAAVPLREETPANKNLFKPPQEFESGFIPMKNTDPLNANRWTVIDNPANSLSHQQQLSLVPSQPQNFQYFVRPITNEESAHVPKSSVNKIQTTNNVLAHQMIPENPGDYINSELEHQRTQTYNAGTEPEFYRQPYQQYHSYSEQLPYSLQFETLNNPTEAPVISLIQKMPEFIKQQISSLLSSKLEEPQEEAKKAEAPTSPKRPLIRLRDRVHLSKGEQKTHEEQVETRNKMGGRRKMAPVRNQGVKMTNIHIKKDDQTETPDNTVDPVVKIHEPRFRGSQFRQKTMFMSPNNENGQRFTVTDREKISGKEKKEDEKSMNSQSIHESGRRQFVSRPHLRGNRRKSQHKSNENQSELQRTMSVGLKLEKNSRHSVEKPGPQRLKLKYGASTVPSEKTSIQVERNQFNQSPNNNSDETDAFQNKDITPEIFPPTRNFSQGSLAAEKTNFDNIGLKNPSLMLSNDKNKPAAFITGPRHFQSSNSALKSQTDYQTPVLSLKPEDIGSENVAATNQSVIQTEMTNKSSAFAADLMLSQHISNRSSSDDQTNITTTPTVKGDILLINEKMYSPLRSMLTPVNNNIVSKSQGPPLQGMKSGVRYNMTSQPSVLTEFQDLSTGIPTDPLQGARNGMRHNPLSQLLTLGEFQDLSVRKPLGSSQGGTNRGRYDSKPQLSFPGEFQDDSTREPVSMQKAMRGKVKYNPMS